MSRARTKAPATGELHLIDSFLAPFGLSRDGISRLSPSAGVKLGPGDDCAQLLPAKGMTLVATTDAALDGVHFQLARSRPEDAGWKALAMNLSDLAAAGARPRWFLCAVGVPTVGTQNNSPDELAKLMRGFGTGMAQLSRRSGCALVGGNVTRALQWSLTITALGEAKKPLSRAGGKPGDLLVLAGELGAAALGLSLLQSGKGNSYEHQRLARETALDKGERDSLRAQLRPEPRLEAGLLAAGLASTAIDISDGLLRDLGQLLERSGCGAELDCEALPRSGAVQAAEALAAAKGEHPYALSLAGGEDYSLLLAVPPARAEKLLALLAHAKLPACLIGKLTPPPRSRAQPAIALFENRVPLPLPEHHGFDHLTDLTNMKREPEPAR